jgi:hypothetical protein
MVPEAGTGQWEARAWGDLRRMRKLPNWKQMEAVRNEVPEYFPPGRA